MSWIKGEPPKDGKTYLLKFYTDIICSGSYRCGDYNEPQMILKAWRCDCCGRFAEPKEWMEIPK